jgi:hypothetical protein
MHVSRVKVAVLSPIFACKPSLKVTLGIELGESSLAFHRSEHNIGKLNISLFSSISQLAVALNHTHDFCLYRNDLFLSFLSLLFIVVALFKVKSKSLTLHS